MDLVVMDCLLWITDFDGELPREGETLIKFRPNHALFCSSSLQRLILHA